MGAYIRRFSADPGLAILLNIESVNILDLQPPGPIKGVGSGAVNIVGEFEDGPDAGSMEVASPQDLQSNFGLVGYTYGGVVANNPSAISRKADGALVPEFWNGNGMVQLSGKQFGRLFITRVDTSVGTVQLTRLAYLSGSSSFRYTLAAGQVLSLDVGAGYTSATFTATAATVTAVGGTYPTTFAGGETLTLGYDGVPNFTVTFQAADQTNAQVVARINQFAGFAFADLNGGQLRLTGLQLGNGAQVRVVSSTGGVNPVTQLGLTIATTFGTGNVANIAAVTPGEVTTIVQAAIANTRVEQTQTGVLRISSTVAQTANNTNFISVGPATTALNLGFAVGAFASSVGQAVLLTSAQTFPDGFVGGETLTLAVDGFQATVTFQAADTTQANVITRINAAFPVPVCVADDATHMVFYGQVPGKAIQVISATGAAAPLTKLGLVVGTTTGALPTQGPLPAGTVVQQPNGQVFVTRQTLTFTGGLVSLPGVTGPIVQNNANGQPNYSGPWSVKVRHAKDDGTGTSAGAATVTSMPNAPDIGSFSVTNTQLITAALTESAIDVQYGLAILATEDVNSVAKQTNLIYSARQSNSIRKALKADAFNASSNGCFGRIAVIRPPLGTTKQLAMSTTQEPGVGAYRDTVGRVVYTFPQVSTTVPAIATRGVSGGAGFTANGAVDVGADGFLASAASQLPPEEDPAQDADLVSAINSLESSPNAQGFSMQDYINFKAAGICAPRIDDGTPGFQSGVTTVDPNLYPSRVQIAARRMSDFIQDSIAQKGKANAKKLMTLKRRVSYAKDIETFLRALLSPLQPDNQRIGGFTVDRRTGNTQQTLGQGLYRIIIDVQLLPEFLSTVLQTTIGTTVSVVEMLPQAA